MIKASEVRGDFPALRERDGRRPIYLDSASTTPKPRAVIDAVARCYEDGLGNVHRGVHALAERTSEAFEEARGDIAALVGADASEIIFTHGATAALNLLAAGLGLGPEDEVLLPRSEHHSNELPWRERARVVPIDLDAEGVISLAALEAALGPRARVVTLAHVSNVVGRLVPIAEIAAAARARGAVVVVDAAQSVGHAPIDVRALGADAVAFSGHKMLGPSGTGVLWARRELLDRLRPIFTGGGMVAGRDASERAVPREAPYGFEAGTPNIEGAIGLGAAARYLRSLGMDEVRAHAEALGRAIVEEVVAIPQARIVGGAGDSGRAPRLGLVSISLDTSRTSVAEVARILSDTHGILVSGGTHCAVPLHRALGYAATLRVSANVFTTEEDVAALGAALREVVRYFG